MIKIKREEINPIISNIYNFTQISTRLNMFFNSQISIAVKVAQVCIIPIKFDIRSKIAYIFGPIQAGFSGFIQDVSRL